MHKDNKKYVIKLKFVNPANFYYLYPVMAMTQNYKARILKASAGSGKTYSLAREYIYNTLRNQPGETDADFNPNVYRTILAVTFTNKATEEMKSRILKQINLLATGGECEFLDDLIAMTSLPERVLRQRALRVRSAILHDYSRFSILTNDTFFQRIVRAFAKELNIDMDYAIELDTAPVVQKSVDMLIERAEKDQFLQQWWKKMNLKSFFRVNRIRKRKRPLQHIPPVKTLSISIRSNPSPSFRYSKKSW